MTNELLLGTIRLPYGNHNLKQIKSNLPKANYGSIKRNSSMPGLNLPKREEIPLREVGLSHRNYSRVGNDVI
jgi:hypothetical protein